MLLLVLIRDANSAPPIMHHKVTGNLLFRLLSYLQIMYKIIKENGHLYSFL